MVESSAAFSKLYEQMNKRLAEKKEREQVEQKKEIKYSDTDGVRAAIAAVRNKLPCNIQLADHMRGSWNDHVNSSASGEFSRFLGYCSRT